MEDRYFKISSRIYKELDERLSNSNYLAGENYTIADIATFPWIARHKWHDIGLKNFANLTRWYLEISERDAVKKGYDLLKNGDKVPKSLILNKDFHLFHDFLEPRLTKLLLVLL